MNLPESLRRLTLSVRGRSRDAALRVPTAGEILPLVIDPAVRSPSLVEESLVQELVSVIASLDGEPPTEEDARAIARAPEELARFAQVRNALYDHLAAAGRAFARCPRCAADAEVDLPFFWLVLGLPPWSFFDRGILMHVPSLANRLPPGRRPPGPRATAIAYRYPADPALEGALRSLQTDDARRREAEAWDRWVTPGIEDTEGHWHWRVRVPGFRAIFRLSVAIDPSPDRSSLSPEAVEALPIGAYLFLDLLHFATNNVDVPAGRAEVACPSCQLRFLPFF